MAREDRRDSADERRQLNVIETCCKKIAEQYGIELDLSDFTNVSRGKNSKYVSRNGEIVLSSERKRNKCYDTKTMDAVTYFRNQDGVSAEIYYVCKYTKENGGQQGTIVYEIGTTKKCFTKNTNETIVACFMLEGGFWSQDVINDIEFDNEKTFFINTENFEQVITNILKIKKII